MNEIVKRSATAARRATVAASVSVVAALAAVLLTACETGDDTSCNIYYQEADEHFHYCSVNGVIVPDSKVPGNAARKPGAVYKAPAAKPGVGGKPAFKAPAAPARRR